MTPDLDKKLCDDFPLIFRDRQAPPTVSLMHFGFECGNGWEPLIRTLCQWLMWDVNNLKSKVSHHENQLNCTDKSQWSGWQLEYYTEPKLAELKSELDQALENLPVAVQVKEKYGTLRFYVTSASDEHRAIIEFAEMLSASICEECGAMKNVQRYTLGWIKTLCDQHADELYGVQAGIFRDRASEHTGC